MSGGGGALSRFGTTPPRNTHRAWSHPLEKLQRPRRTNPSSTFSTVPDGAYDDEIKTLSSLPQTSFWAASENRPSCQLWTAVTPRTQALDPQAVPTSRTAS